MGYLLFDIETGPLDDETLRARRPFNREAMTETLTPAPFNEAAVKVGNLKDPEKIAEKIAAARREHALAVDAVPGKLAEAEAYHVDLVRSYAALSAATGQVLAIGYHVDTEPNAIVSFADAFSDVGGEAGLLLNFWNRVRLALSQHDSIIGFNICGFDLPFLVRRSWMLGLPTQLGSLLDGGKWWKRQVVDLLDVWKLGGRGTDDSIKLDELCQLLDVSGKLEGCDGAMFAELYASDRVKARKYLEADVLATLAVAERLYVL